ncbi:MAG: hypothetical protein U5K27_02245 [Desulfotignum sp.]|nr:hypothetical protein [Desulfotignum sp.]
MDERGMTLHLGAGGPAADPRHRAAEKEGSNRRAQPRWAASGPALPGMFYRDPVRVPPTPTHLGPRANPWILAWPAGAFRRHRPGLPPEVLARFARGRCLPVSGGCDGWGRPGIFVVTVAVVPHFSDMERIYRSQAAAPGTPRRPKKGRGC